MMIGEVIIGSSAFFDRMEHRNRRGDVSMRMTESQLEKIKKYADKYNEIAAGLMRDFTAKDLLSKIK